MTSLFHLVRLTPSASFDVQAAVLLERTRPVTPPKDPTTLADVLILAQYVDLVEAGFGAKDITFQLARKCLSNAVKLSWREARFNSLCAQSAVLADLLEVELVADELSFEFPCEQAYSVRTAA